MALARKLLIALLCDAPSGRKGWIESRIEELAQILALGVGGFSVKARISAELAGILDRIGSSAKRWQLRNAVVRVMVGLPVGRRAGPNPFPYNHPTGGESRDESWHRDAAALRLCGSFECFTSRLLSWSSSSVPLSNRGE